MILNEKVKWQRISIVWYYSCKKEEDMREKIRNAHLCKRYTEEESRPPKIANRVERTGRDWQLPECTFL